MTKKLLAIIGYSFLGLLLAVFIFFAISSSVNAPFILALQRDIVKSTSLTSLDIFSVAQWGIGITTVVLVGLLVFFDERLYRKGLKNK